MKTIISLLLVFVTLNMGFAQSLPTLPPADPMPPLPELTPEEKAAGWIVGAIFLTVCAVGAYVIIKVSSNVPSDTAPTTFVLESSNDNYSWTPIATNRVVLAGRRPIECFKDRIDGHWMFYRTRIMR